MVLTDEEKNKIKADEEVKTLKGRVKTLETTIDTIYNEAMAKIKALNEEKAKIEEQIQEKEDKNKVEVDEANSSLDRIDAKIVEMRKLFEINPK